jgi:hypothetical protein
MSAGSCIKQVEHHDTMGLWKGLHVGMIPCYRSKSRHAMWKWGKKKGLRRARRRHDKDLVVNGLRER